MSTIISQNGSKIPACSITLNSTTGVWPTATIRLSFDLENKIVDTFLFDYALSRAGRSKKEYLASPISINGVKLRSNLSVSADAFSGGVMRGNTYPIEDIFASLKHNNSQFQIESEHFSAVMVVPHLAVYLSKANSGCVR